MPWKQGYTISDEVGLRDDEVQWPDGNRCCVSVVVDLSVARGPEGIRAADLMHPEAQFGAHDGLDQLLAVLRHFGITATFAVPAVIAELRGDRIRALLAEGHEIADHMWEHHVPKDPALERDHLLKTADALEAIAGRRPVGSRSEHTPALLKQEGFLYISHESADHRPYYLSDADGGATILNLPFHYAIDDAMFYSFAWLGSGNAAQRITDPDRVFDLWWAAFWQQYRAGGYLNIVVHPFVSGRALRIDMLDRLITRMKSLPGVWFPTCEQVARHCLEHFPPRRNAA